MVPPVAVLSSFIFCSLPPLGRMIKALFSTENRAIHAKETLCRKASKVRHSIRYENKTCMQAATFVRTTVK